MPYRLHNVLRAAISAENPCAPLAVALVLTMHWRHHGESYKRDLSLTLLSEPDYVVMLRYVAAILLDGGAAPTYAIAMAAEARELGHHAIAMVLIDSRRDLTPQPATGWLRPCGCIYCVASASHVPPSYSAGYGEFARREIDPLAVRDLAVRELAGHLRAQVGVDYESALVHDPYRKAAFRALRAAAPATGPLDAAGVADRLAPWTPAAPLADATTLPAAEHPAPAFPAPALQAPALPAPERPAGALPAAVYPALAHPAGPRGVAVGRGAGPTLECAVCGERRPLALAMPCKHLATCFECAATLAARRAPCVMCRAAVASYEDTYAPGS